MKIQEFVENTLKMDIVSFELTIIFITLVMVIGLGIAVWSLDRDNEELERMIERLIDERKSTWDDDWANFVSEHIFDCEDEDLEDDIDENGSEE